jgi:threonyl-tRNA synthetase
LLAQAVQQLFPGTQVTIGPTVEGGFYYDFASGHNFTLEDLDKIEARMVELAADDLSVERIVAPRDKAIEIFRNMGEHYKVQIIEDLPEDEEISIYRQGEWMDLCRGPHVPSTGKLQAFTLTKVAGAYWRGDANNQQLQRIYGTAWPNKKQLKAYLNRIAEAEKRDHRKIAKKTQSVSHSGRSAGHGVLASCWLDHLSDHRTLYA